MFKDNSKVILQKPKPFIAPGSQTPVTSEEIERRKKRLERLEQIGEEPTRITEDEYANPYKLEAIALINEDKDVPEELIKKINEFDRGHKPSDTSSDFTIEDIHKVYFAKKQGEYTVEDFYEFPEDMLVELIDGAIFHLGTPSLAHQEVIAELFYHLKDYVVKNKEACEVLTLPLAVQLDCDDKTMVLPDIIVLCDKNKITPQCIFGAPDMVVEVLSPSTRKRDLTEKLAKYMSAGVREYWIIDLDKKRVLVYNWDKDAFPTIYGFDSKIPVGVFEGKCIIDFGELS